MDTIKINKKNVLMIAHRGLSGLETENTKEAFILAGSKSYYGIETDVHVTKDKKFLVFHDDNILRLTGVDLETEEKELWLRAKIVLQFIELRKSKGYSQQDVADIIGIKNF